MTDYLRITEDLMNHPFDMDVAIVRVSHAIANRLITEFQALPYRKLLRYLEGVKKVEESLEDSCKLSDKLFGNPEKRVENAMRVCETVVSADTEKKIEYLINATRGLLVGGIDVEMMFRIFRAITESLPEDLEYLSSIIEKDGPFIGNTTVHALSSNGMMVLAGIYGDRDIEEQQYHISKLGYMVDMYALSLSNEERYKFHKRRDRGNKQKRAFEAPVEMSENEIDEMFEPK